MTGGAFQIDPQEDLADVLRRLHGRLLAGVDDSAPNDPLGEPLGSGFAGDQAAYEFVIGSVFRQSSIQPRRDLLASAVDETGSPVIVAQEIIPETHPVFGVILSVREQFPEQAVSLVVAGVRREVVHRVDRREQSQDVEPGPAQESAIVDRIRGSEIVFLEIGRDEGVHRVHRGKAKIASRKIRAPGLKIEGRFFGETDRFVPRQSPVDPGPDQTDLLGRQPSSLLRHHVVGIDARDKFHQITGGAVPRLDGRARIGRLQQIIPVVQVESSLALALAVALDATGLQQRGDVAGEVDLSLEGFRQRRVFGPHGDSGSAR